MAARRRQLVIKDLERFVEKNVARLQLRLFQILVSATPVDTGFARAGWSPAAGTPKPGPDTPESRETGIAQAQSLFATHQVAAQQIAQSYRLQQGPVFITNNVRYITFLNQGSSAQAPAQFVEASIVTAVRATQAEIRQAR